MDNLAAIINLKVRLQELPKAAYDLVNPDTLGITPQGFNKIMRGDSAPSLPVILKFCEILGCTVEEFIDPKYRFTDFRTAKQMQEDQVPQ